jgi:hypothetical protein
MSRYLAWAAFVLCFRVLACGQTQPPAKPQPHSPVIRPAAPNKTPWDFSLTVDGYLIEGEDGYAQPTFTADHKWLHLEARYNYENFRTGSLWGGYNFSWGNDWQFSVTPMIGGVFGRTNGIAPGCEASVAWKILTFSLDNEYVFDTTSKSGNFYYAWPQLTIQPLSWFNFGGVAQHTKVFQTSKDIQRGFFIGFQHKDLEFTTYVFEPGGNNTSVVLEVSATFSKSH